MVNHIFLTGFMGSGKSTAGRLVAEKLNRPFIDLDAEIERREDATVTEIFRCHGEAGFREAEHRALEALASAAPSVIATGGGVVLREDNQVLLRFLGAVVYLAVTPEEAMARIGSAGDRPLLARGGLETARQILEARLAVYSHTADYVVDTTGLSVREVSERVVQCVGTPSCEIVHVGDVGESAETGEACLTGYDVMIGAGLIDELGVYVSSLAPGAKVAVVADEYVWEILGTRVTASLDVSTVSYSLHLVKPGESSKSWETAGALLESFAAAGLDRKSLVVAVGGGVVGDLAGFCAATYMRGIRVLQVPTTLLAQVDSSVGGKTGVDLAAGKNLAGAFWPPVLVLADTGTLGSLSGAELTNGLVEAAKGVLLDGGAPLERFEANVDALLDRNTGALQVAVYDAVAFKARIVTDDLRESGLRECLNLGHTFGHALEVRAGYGRVSHGCAVAEGMRFAARLAERLGVAKPGVSERVEEVLERIGAGTAVLHALIADVSECLEPTALYAAMKSDKKSRGGLVRFVLLEEPGCWRVVPIEDSVLIETLEEWCAMQRGGR